MAGALYDPTFKDALTGMLRARSHAVLKFMVMEVQVLRTYDAPTFGKNLKPREPITFWRDATEDDLSNLGSIPVTLIS